MSISAQQVKELRDQTGVGFLDARSALEESGGDFDKAVDFLREKGLAKAMSPKPSNSGLRPGTELASPSPKAATKGTVTVEVVTPPESYASEMMSRGAK